jgi:hypothetical protein
VGELRQGKLYEKQLEEWTEGVEAKVVPLLKQVTVCGGAAGGAGAMSVAQYREVLESIGRDTVAADVYRSSVHERVDATWQSFSAGQDGATSAALSAWIEGFFGKVVEQAQQDLGWCGDLLASPSSVVRGDVAAAVGSVSPSFAQRIGACMRQLDATEGTDLLCTLHTAALRFAEALESACSQPAEGSSAELLDESELAAIFRNFVTLHKDYTQREAERFATACKEASKALAAAAGAGGGAGAAANAGVDALRSHLMPVSDHTTPCCVQNPNLATAGSVRARPDRACICIMICTRC